MQFIEEKINVNWKVKVKLNDFGRKVYYQHYAEINYDPPALKEDADGYTTFQLHELMFIFGKEMYTRSVPPFSPSIILIKEIYD